MIKDRAYVEKISLIEMLNEKRLGKLNNEVLIALTIRRQEQLQELLSISKRSHNDYDSLSECLDNLSQDNSLLIERNKSLKTETKEVSRAVKKVSKKLDVVQGQNDLARSNFDRLLIKIKDMSIISFLFWRHKQRKEKS